MSVMPPNNHARHMRGFFWRQLFASWLVIIEQIDRKTNSHMLIVI